MGVKLRLFLGFALALGGAPSAGAQCLLCAQDKMVGTAARKAEVPLLRSKSGEVTLRMYDGGFTTMAPPEM